LRRGEIWTASGGKDYAGKPRPVVIVQDDRFETVESVTVCALTTNPAEAPVFRLLVEPDSLNGLRSQSRLMVDKVYTVPKSKIGLRIGRLTDEDMLRLNRALVVFLGLSS
jgi:mRNA interferase MazF